eukprot:TRINITY_DN9816_c0_g1_i6.p1 TRINITY_DN9816_c0_g1~~TRINITY_DN9816_c0_g1_i6.p1  ORF type:complete len:288 (-),score=39.60 TRINITY_DN9816_c0_g1_i6:337-1200(-)
MWPAMFLFFFSLVVSKPLWGKSGHEMTAQIAEALLDSNVLSQCSQILNGATLESVATWADDIKHEPEWEWTSPLHYINCPDWACDYLASRDCPQDFCVDGAIQNYTALLAGGTGSLDIYLKFLIHYHGDIHQPLHVGFTSDEGGNTIHGTFDGFSDNLHTIWDEYILYDRMDQYFQKNQSQYVNYLVGKIQGEWAYNASQWISCDGSSTQLICPGEWADESALLACQKAYTDENGNHIQDGFNLGSGYFEFTYPTIDVQLAKGGVRLANTLTILFGSSPFKVLSHQF